MSARLICRLWYASSAFLCCKKLVKNQIQITGKYESKSALQPVSYSAKAPCLRDNVRFKQSWFKDWRYWGTNRGLDEHGRQSIPSMIENLNLTLRLLLQ